jgi:putative toxin-antitoxin system antitoxin component (TIGR02293 family)
MKNYKTKDERSHQNILEEPDPVYLINTSRKGVEFAQFNKIADKLPFLNSEWCSYLHISERTMHRYKKEKKSFDTIQSERILEINYLFQKGTQVFGSYDVFGEWLDATNIALGGVKPKDLLDSTFGISLIKDELIRIEHGVFA